MSTYRKVPRAPLNVYLNKIVGNSVFMCRAANISEQGIFLARLLEPELAGRELSLEFALPGDDEVLWAHGTVVREGEHHACAATGIKFTVLPDRYRERIQAYVQRYDLGLASAA